MAASDNIDKKYLQRLEIANFTVRALYEKKTRNSYCWKHFGFLVVQKDNKRIQVLEEQVFCNVCLSKAKSENDTQLFGAARVKSYSKNISTGNLSRHLRNDHDLREESTSTQQSMKSFFTMTPRPSTSTARTAQSNTCDKWLLARDLALWFCRSLMPFNSVSDEGMQDFFLKHNVIGSTDDLPSRFTIAGTALDDVYECCLAHIKDIIRQDASNCGALTFDLWSDQYRKQNYITFTYHYLTKDFHLKYYTLSTCIITGKKTGENINNHISEIKHQFGLYDKTLFAVTDAGANVKRAANLAALNSHLCLGHGLHNLVNVDGINSTPEIKALVTKCKKIVKKIRYRLPELEAEADKEQLKMIMSLEQSGEDLENDERDPIIDDLMAGNKDEEMRSDEEDTNTDDLSKPVPSIKTSTPTRWHSVLAMLESLNHSCNRNAVNTLLGKIGLEELKLNNFEWKLLTDLLTFLKKFKSIVEILSSQKQTSLNVGLVFRSEIKEALEALDDTEPLIMLTLKRNMLEKLNHRFPITNLMIAATLLDCRFQCIRAVDEYLEAINKTRVSFLSEYIKDTTKNDIFETQESECQVPGTSSQSNETVSSLLIKLSEKHSGTQSTDDPVDQECWKYFATCMPQDLNDGDLLKYWYKNKNVFPWLSKLAKSILAIPATSTPSERVFSIAGLVLSAKRSRLSSNRVNKILFVHDNYSACKDSIL